MERKYIVLVSLGILVVYFLAPLVYIVFLNAYSLEVYTLFLEKGPFKWSEIYSVLSSVDREARVPLSILLTHVQEKYWRTAAEILSEAPPKYYADTVAVLLLVDVSEWKYVEEAIVLYKKGYMPYRPPSLSLKKEYVEPLAISGEEPVEDWKYIIYIFTYRLVCNKSSALEAAKYLCFYVHKYMTYDWNYWHRRSPRVLIKLKRGTCTNFSILYVAMCRSMGIPARLVRDNSITSATHAWSEVYIEGYGWIHADPSAGYFNYSQLYLEKWGYSFHLVKAFNPVKGWIDITPRYVPDYGIVEGKILLKNALVCGAEIRIYYPGNDRIPLFELKTNCSGSFSFTAAEGTYILKISYGNMFKTVIVKVKAKEKTLIEIDLSEKDLKCFTLQSRCLLIAVSS